MNKVEVTLNWYQDKYLFNDARFSCLIGGVGTGKTFSFLLKAWQYCQDNPKSLGLIIRKEFTDLRDSTIQDFEKYFNVKINRGNKEYEFPNGSKIMFRHGDMNDINVLKNINLSFFCIVSSGIIRSQEDVSLNSVPRFAQSIGGINITIPSFSSNGFAIPLNLHIISPYSSLP